MVQQSSSDDSSSDSDDEMRSRLMETVVTVEQIKKDEKKKGFGFSQSNNLPNVDIDKIFHNLGGKPSEEKNSNLIKVGPYGDIELSQGQINRLITILRSEINSRELHPTKIAFFREYTENTLEFRSDSFTQFFS